MPLILFGIALGESFKTRKKGIHFQLNLIFVSLSLKQNILILIGNHQHVLLLFLYNSIKDYSDQLHSLYLLPHPVIVLTNQSPYFNCSSYELYLLNLHSVSILLDLYTLWPHLRKYQSFFLVEL